MINEAMKRLEFFIIDLTDEFIIDSTNPAVKDAVEMRGLPIKNKSSSWPLALILGEKI